MAEAADGRERGPAGTVRGPVSDHGLSPKRVTAPVAELRDRAGDTAVPMRELFALAKEFADLPRITTVVR